MFGTFFDDAALFPPGNLPFAEAIPAHHSHHAAWYAACVGTFVAPASRLDELADHLDGRPLRLSLTVPGGPSTLPDAVRRVAELESVRLESVEVALRAEDSVDDLLTALTDLPDGVAAYIEVPRDDRRISVLDALKGTPYRAKFRTGGVVPEAHPGEPELAASIVGAVAREVPFKCTAGLHHALRHTDGDLEQHGFLNVLLATAAALDGRPARRLAALLAERSDAKIVERITPDVVAAARGMFTSFGTCSVTDPVSDLTKLGLLAGPRGDS